MLEPGLQATVGETVTEDMTADRLGSGDVPVLGTPAVLALVESAAVAAVADHLDDGDTTVGAAVELHHVAPTAAGALVEATAALRRRTTAPFRLRGHGSRRPRGPRHARRVVVERRRFLDSARERTGQPR